MRVDEFTRIVVVQYDARISIKYTFKQVTVNISYKNFFPPTILSINILFPHRFSDVILTTFCVNVSTEGLSHYKITPIPCKT